jgi:glycosyltransferase involved in cell wall biosynthesis
MTRVLDDEWTTHELEWPWPSPLDLGDPASAATPLPLSVLIPTRNEAGNVDAVIERLAESLAGLPAEAIFVDDSDDDTPHVIATARRRRPATDRLNVAMVHREPGARLHGLGGAVVAGLARARGTWVCVMDGDLQHPPETILVMLAAAESRGATFVVASRYCAGGDAAGLGKAGRRVGSWGAGTAARLMFRQVLGSVTDPMSGFFLFRRDAVDPRALRPRGFKILMEMAVRTPGLRITEVPYVFERRHAGESKANGKVAITYVRHLGRLRLDVTRARLAHRNRST